MKQQPMNDPDYWRERAKEARRVAEQLSDEFSKQTMLKIAKSYDSLAALTRTNARSKPSS
jgi:hypothetical protein